MEEQKRIKAAIEKQRKKLDHMAIRVRDLTELLEEGQKMDRLVEAYEETVTNS